MYLAFISAVLFAISIPLSKFLTLYFSPLLLSSIYYLSMFISGFIYRRFLSKKSFVINFEKMEIIYLLTMVVFGGVLAPVFMFISINKINVSSASLFSNFEMIFTVLIALIFMKESKDVNFFIGFLLSVFGVILLNFKGLNLDFNIYHFYYLVSMLFWGIDNNITAKLSDKDPIILASIKGLVGGMISLILSFFFEFQIFNLKKLSIAVFVGFFCYGMSLIFLILSFRFTGISRASIIFNSYPFIAFLISVFFLNETLTKNTLISFLLFLSGFFFILKTKHSHQHSHLLSHEHFHSHDEHHIHHQFYRELLQSHSHYHTHNIISHTHNHHDDSHHKHH